LTIGLEVASRVTSPLLIEGRRHELAQRASCLASSPAFFGFCIALVLAWLGGYAGGAGASYEQATGSALTATTLLLVTGSPV